MNTFFRQKRHIKPQAGQRVFVSLIKYPLVLSSLTFPSRTASSVQTPLVPCCCIIFPETVVAGLLLPLCISKKKQQGVLLL